MVVAFLQELLVLVLLQMEYDPNYEIYLVRAREAQLAGDAVEMENCYQYAEHYWRVMRDAETAR